MRIRNAIVGLCVFGLAGLSQADPVAPGSTDEGADQQVRGGGPPDFDCGVDFNGDGVTNFVDIIEFITAFSEGDASADFNADGSVDFMDIIAFIIVLRDGCLP